MKLKDNKIEFDIFFLPVTGKISRVFYDCDSRMPKDNSLMEKKKVGLAMLKYIDDKDRKNAIEKGIIPESAIIKALNSNDPLLTKLLETDTVTFTPTEKALVNDLTIEMFRATIDLDTLTDKQKELVQSDIQSDFWQSQNLEDIRIELSKFRAKVS